MSSEQPPSTPQSGSAPATGAPATSSSAAATPTTPAAAAEAAASTAKAGASAGTGAHANSTAGLPPKAPAQPLHGFRAALEHTGIPRSVLLWKPKLPSRNWSIFFGVIGTLSYLYYDDRKKAKQIRQEYIDKVSYLAQQATSGSLDIPRKVKVYGARFPEDDDTDRSLRYFRKYVKPYLVAAAVDYEQVHAPLYGSIARIVRAKTVRDRRVALGIEEADATLSLPGVLSPETVRQRELEGGTILIGRPSLKEYLAGLHLAYNNGVNEWVWEKEIDRAIKNDGVFDEPVTAAPDAPAEPEPEAAPLTPATPNYTNLSFLSRPPPTPAVPAAAPAPAVIPEAWHAAPDQLPPQPPILLVPFHNHLGFKQIPFMIYDWFTERKRVQAGAEAAYALLTNEIRPFVAPGEGPTPDTDFDTKAESYYKNRYEGLPERTEQARKDYYKDLAPRLESARQFARGERGLTDEEKKSDKPIVTEDALREERRKKELRWLGAIEGFEIVRPEAPVAWDPKWNGWLRVFDTSKKD
ncbi:mitochondrial import inner membrane translocase subunit tim54 [Vanrija albida]|uniref:Mitochondrial import inner membrane translocase subunit TIM54 n=1 Tax=Vanrija albida TaxID=181172 RepID=A0ABR3Q4S6_9TREE